jgi:hypothetical protein
MGAASTPSAALDPYPVDDPGADWGWPMSREPSEGFVVVVVAVGTALFLTIVGLAITAICVIGAGVLQG